MRVCIARLHGINKLDKNLHEIYVDENNANYSTLITVTKCMPEEGLWLLAAPSQANHDTYPK